MRAYVLSGGLGTRLRAVTGELPKALAPVGGRAFLDLQLEWLAELGVDECRLALGVGAEAIARHLEARDPSARPRVTFAVEKEPLGTAGALRFVAAEERERHLAVNGDTLAEIDLAVLVTRHERLGAVATVACYRVDEARERGTVEFDAEGRVRSFREKAARGPGWVSGGLVLCEPAVERAIPADRPSSLEREIFPALIERGETIGALDAEGRFWDIGTPEGLERAAREWPAAAREGGR